MIEFIDVHKSYKKSDILRGLSFKIEDGELVSIIGPSGCGKTTCLKMINGLIRPSSGDVLVNGESILKADIIKLRRKMGYVIQQTGLFPHMTIKQNIEIIPKLAGVKDGELEKKTRSIMEIVGLDPDEYLWRYPAQLSGGQLQRIGVARAFAVDPDIILMDEPFSALDPVTREQLQDEMTVIQDRFHKTVVFVTHDMDEAVKISDKICIMNDGLIVQYDTPENILKSPADEFVENFVGANRIWSNPSYIRAKDIMLKNPIKTNDRCSVLKATEIMRRKKVDSIFIVDRDNRLQGVALARAIRNEQNVSAPIGKFMRQPKATVAMEDDIVELLSKSRKLKASRMPVLDGDGRLMGLITESSLATTLSSQFIEIEGDGDNE